MFIKKSKFEEIIVETFAEGFKAGQTSEKLFGEQSRRTPNDINRSCGFSPIDDQTTITRNNSRRYLLKSVGVKPKHEIRSIINAMNMLVLLYGRVSVADFYELCGMSSTFIEATDNWYGWMSTNDMTAEPRFGGYEFVMPAQIKF